VPAIGVYRGVVTSNVDPQKTGRVQVQVPALGVSSTWAVVCSSGGAGRASYPIGSSVIVAFEGGDSSWPVVLGRIGT